MTQAEFAEHLQALEQANAELQAQIAQKKATLEKNAAKGTNQTGFANADEPAVSGVSPTTSAPTAANGISPTTLAPAAASGVSPTTLAPAAASGVSPTTSASVVLSAVPPSASVPQFAGSATSQTADGNPLFFQFSPSTEAAANANTEMENRVTQNLEAELARYKNWTWKKDQFTVTPYGWFWLTGVWESNQMVPGDYPLYVQNRRGDNEEAHAYFDAKSMRLGTIVTAPESSAMPGVRIGGVLEFDFEGQFDIENRPDALLRKAYIEMKHEDFYVLLGKTWDFIGPLNMTMINWGSGAGGGNFGYRHPMFRVDRYFHRANGKWTVQAGVASSNTSNLSGTIHGTYVGKMGRIPDFTCRLERSFDHFGPWDKAAFGLAGRYAMKEFRCGDRRFERDSWTICGDWILHFNKRCFISGECYCGELCAGQAAAIFQDINPYTFQSVGTTGGWLALSYRMTDQLTVTGGYAADDPWNSRMSNGMRSLETISYANMDYAFTKQFSLGFEYAYYTTDYYTQGTAKSNHLTLVVNYRL